MKLKKCKICEAWFTPIKTTQPVCSKRCELIYNTKHMKKSNPQKSKPIKKKPKQKKLQTLLKEFEKVFNTYIRLRDKGKPCISCGEYNELQAGHYFAVSGYKALGFDEDNVHGEGACCNVFNESHLILYGINLIKKIGASDYSDLVQRAELYKAGKLNNDYYQNGKWNREAIEKGIERYKNLIR